MKVERLSMQAERNPWRKHIAITIIISYIVLPGCQCMLIADILCLHGIFIVYSTDF